MRNDSKRFNDILRTYELARLNHTTAYLEALDLLDIYDFYADHMRNDEALEVLNKAFKEYPDDEEVVVAQAYYHKNIGEWDEAKRIINRLSPTHDMRLLFYAEEALSTMDYQRCEELVNQIYKQHGQDEFAQEAAQEIGDLYYELGYYWLAEPWLEKCATPDYPMFSHVVAELADCLFRRGEYERAISLLNSYLDEDPYSADTWVQLAKILHVANRYEEALECCDYAIAAQSDSPEAYTVRFDTLIQLGRYDELWEQLQTPSLQVYCSPESYLHLGMCFGEKDEYEKAIAVYRQAARLFYDNKEVRDQIHRHLAFHAATEHRMSDAHDIIFRNMDRENYIGRYISYATLQFLSRQFEEALQTLREASALPTFSRYDYYSFAILLHNAQIFYPAKDIWEAIFEHADTEELPQAAIFANAAYMLADVRFADYMKVAYKNDLTQLQILFHDDFDIADKAKTMRKARALVRKWKQMNENP